MLKSHDIVVLCKLLSYEKGKNTKFGYKNLSKDLGLSLGECHNSIKRLLKSNLIVPNIENKFRPIHSNVLEFFVHGFKYIFPVDLKAIDRGVGTSLSSKPFKNIFNSSVDYVWPYYKGNMKGQVIEPLSKNCVEACVKDENLYKNLSILDMLRVGQARERIYAIKYLEKELS